MKSVFIIGLMSGTSMDGINATLVKTNGLTLERYNFNEIYFYSKKTKFLLNKTIMSTPTILQNKNKMKKLDELITFDHYKAITNFIQKFNLNPDIIGFHGQTIYHNADNNISIQLGNPKTLSKLLNIKVVGDFRKNDLKNGGQGAPLAPIYHRYLMQNHNTDLPSCFLNIGGVANVTYWDGKSLLGFDTGPGNGFMDWYMQKQFNKPYDENGQLAKKGTPKKEIIKKILTNEYFLTKYPKSLDKFTFSLLFDIIKKENLPPEDTLATLLQITVKSIIMSLNSLPNKTESIYVMGGGVSNKYLMDCLNKEKKYTFLPISKINLQGDMIEAELIAFISARTLYNLPSTFPETTGTKTPTIAGNIYI